MSNALAVGREYPEPNWDALDGPTSPDADVIPIRDRTTAPAFESEDMPKLFAANDLAPAAQPSWLARNRLPRSAISLLIGDEGIGKSLFWVWIVAAITRGHAVPAFGIPARAPENVIIVVTEDDWSSTVGPRLHVAGADMTRVFVICTDTDGSGPPLFPRDNHLILDSGLRPGLIVVDTWLDTVPSGLSVKDPQQARRALHPWREIATKTGAAALLLGHTNRMSTGNARDKYGATSELRKKARSTLFAQADKDGDGHLLIGPEKSNTSGQMPASRFRIEAVQHFPPTDDDDGMIPRLIHLGDSEKTARELLSEDHEGSDDSNDDVDSWLRGYLEDGQGSRETNDVYTAADAAGYSRDQAKRAKKRLGIDARKVGKGPWLWVLPG